MARKMAAARAWNEGLVGSCWLSFSLSKKPSSFSPASCYLLPGVLQTDVSRSPSMSQHLLLSESRVSISSAQMISLLKPSLHSKLTGPGRPPPSKTGRMHSLHSAHRGISFCLPTFLSPHWCHRLKMPSTGTEPHTTCSSLMPITKVSFCLSLDSLVDT